jgi:hypothetical protein
MTLRGLLSFTGTSTMGSSSRGSDPDEAQLYVFLAACDCIMLTSQHGRRSHSSRHSNHTHSSPGNGQLVPYRSDYTEITAGTQLVRHRPHHPNSSLVSRRDKRSPSRSLELHEKSSPQSSGVRRAWSRHQRTPGFETYQDIRR